MNRRLRDTFGGNIAREIGFAKSALPTHRLVRQQRLHPKNLCFRMVVDQLLRCSSETVRHCETDRLPIASNLAMLLSSTPVCQLVTNNRFPIAKETSIVNGPRERWKLPHGGSDCGSYVAVLGVKDFAVEGQRLFFISSPQRKIFIIHLKKNPAWMQSLHAPNFRHRLRRCLVLKFSLKLELPRRK